MFVLTSGFEEEQTCAFVSGRLRYIYVVGGMVSWSGPRAHMY